MDKGGEGIKNPQYSLMCYAVKPAKGQPKHRKVIGIRVNNQFGPEVLDTLKEEELCVPPSNQPPHAVEDRATTTEGTVVEIMVLAGDNDPDGDPLTIIGVTQGAHGTVTFTPASVSYTPGPGFVGTDSFTYTISDGFGGTQTATVSVTVNPAPPANRAPTVDAGPDVAVTLPNSVFLDGTVSDDGLPSPPGALTTSWTKMSGPGIVIFGDPSAVDTTAAFSESGTYVLRLSASDGALSASDEVTVLVSPAVLPPEPEGVAPPLSQTSTTDLGSGTSFLYSGSNPIQTGVAPGTIEPTRAAVVRGRVLEGTGTPLPGVVVSILNHPELGRTLSRDDGWFDLAVNGGGRLTVAYAKVGYLPAQRSVDVPWQDFALLPDVVLIQPDPNVTTIDLAAAIPFQVARGSVITDADGTRQDTLLFAQGTMAQMVFADGTTRPVGPILHVRATEYTVGALGPDTMPGELPPTSAYTNATDFHADESSAAGALFTTFSQPVLSYIENFLGFPTGTRVPMGFYDAAKGVWTPADSGVVIKILSLTGGLAELDTDGDGVADNGVALGISNAERQQLASLYGAGTSLWRTPVTHFSGWDRNWGFGPPPDAQPPRLGPPKPDPQPKDPDECEGSIIGCQDQTLGEALNFAGTPFSLSYQSGRVPGRKAAYRAEISLSGPSVPASLKRIDLEVLVAGRLFPQTFPPNPNQRTTFTWDGLDAYGRRVQGQYLATVRIGYVYDGVYQTTDRFGYNGNGIPITGSKTRREVTLWQIDTVQIGPWDARGQGLGGWTLSIHHAYDPPGKVLYLGDGSRRNASGIGAQITTVAGGGGFGGDGGLATGADLRWPSGVAVDSDGSLYIAEYLKHRIRRVDPDRIITTLAGTGNQGFSGDGGPATAANLAYPTGVALAPDGSLYIADQENHRIRRVGPDGIITTVAGTGNKGFGGDGGPATGATLASPSGVAVASDGSLYIADQKNYRIRRVGPDGIITTVAGTGTQGFSGDGGPATKASLGSPSGVAVAPDGSLYIADLSSRIRRVGPDGIITTVAGTGTQGFSGDGGPATRAYLARPNGVAVARDGSLYIADHNNNLIRRVGPDGIITTVAGTGKPRFGGDGSAATGADLNSPSGVAVAPDGSFYIADTQNVRIRRAGPALPGFSAADVAISSEDGHEVYQFDPNGRHLRTLNALTAATLYTFTYDSDGRLTQVTDGNGNVTTIQRDGAGQPTAIVAPFGQQTTLTLDGNGFLASVTDSAGATTQLTYSSDGLLATLTDPKGNLHQFAYDGLGRLLKDQDPVGGFFALNRTETPGTNSYRVGLTSALGRTSTFQVERLSTGDERRVNTDPAGLQSTLLIKTDGSRQTTEPDGMTSTLVESGDPRWGRMAPVLKSLTIATPGGLTVNGTSTRTAILSDVANPLSLTAQDDTLVFNGRTYTSHFDAATRTFTNTSPAGRVSTQTIDAQGRTTSSQVTGLAAANATYDAFGRLATVTAGTGSDARTATFAYDGRSYLQSITDPLGRVTSFTYDAVGRPLTQTLPDGRVIQLGYDLNGNMTSLTPPGRPAHTFDYTPVDLASRYTAPAVTDGGTNQTAVVYDADQAPTTLTRPDGAAVALAYDAAGRLKTTTFSRGQVTGIYDATTGNMSSLTAPDGIGLTYSYDGSLPTGTTWSGPVAGSVARAFDADFRVASQSVNGGNTVSFTYDADSLLTGVGALTLTRNASNGLLTGTTLGAVTDAWTYNAFAEPLTYNAAYSGGGIYTAAYTRDKLGRITRKVETIGSVTTTFDYSYDTAGRLIQVQRNGTTAASYTYDSNGNRLSGPGLGTPPTYDDQDRLFQYGPNSYTYTANGELATKTVGTNTTTYTYDELGNLTRVVLPGGTQIDYLIDGQKRRIGKKVAGVLTQGYLYDGLLRIVAEMDGAGSLVSRFVYATGVNVPDYMIKGGVTYRIVTDHLGSPRLIVDVTTGVVAQRLDYDELGNVLTDTHPGFQPFGFAGGLYDSDTRLVRFGARDYDAGTGRWTTKDPILFGGSLTNLYGYTRNDPVNAADPIGLAQSITIGPGQSTGIISEPGTTVSSTGTGNTYTYRDGGFTGVDPNGEPLPFQPNMNSITGGTGGTGDTSVKMYLPYERGPRGPPKKEGKLSCKVKQYPRSQTPPLTFPVN